MRDCTNQRLNSGPEDSLFSPTLYQKTFSITGFLFKDILYVYRQTMTTQRATCWSVTINNPTPEDEESIARSRQSGWKVEGQLEKGEGGTLHYQLVVKTPQVRFSALKKAFPRAHIEAARNAVALDKYCHKEETAVGTLQESQAMYPSLSQYWTLVVQELDAKYPYGLNADSPEPLILLDQATSQLISRGYNVEGMAVNPQVRSAWKRFSGAIIWRVHTALSLARQTDTVMVEDNIISSVDIPDADPSPTH